MGHGCQCTSRVPRMELLSWNLLAQEKLSSRTRRSQTDTQPSPSGASSSLVTSGPPFPGQAAFVITLSPGRSWHSRPSESDASGPGLSPMETRRPPLLSAGRASSANQRCNKMWGAVVGGGTSLNLLERGPFITSTTQLHASN